MEEPEYVKRIRGNFQTLIKVISAQEIGIFMLQNGGITVKEYEEILGLNTDKSVSSVPHKENSILLLTILHKGEETFHKFVEALNETQMEYVAKHLMEYDTSMCESAVRLKPEHSTECYFSLKEHGYIEARECFFRSRLDDVMAKISEVERRIAELLASVNAMAQIQTQNTTQQGADANKTVNETCNAVSENHNEHSHDEDENQVFTQHYNIEPVAVEMSHVSIKESPGQHERNSQHSPPSHGVMSVRRRGSRRRWRRFSFSSIFCINTTEKQLQSKPDFIHSAIVGAFTTGMLPLMGKEGVDFLEPEDKNNTGSMAWSVC